MGIQKVSNFRSSKNLSGIKTFRGIILHKQQFLSHSCEASIVGGAACGNHKSRYSNRNTNKLR